MMNKMARPMMLLALLVYSSACSDDGPSAPDPRDAAGLAEFTFLGSGFDGHFTATGNFERDGAGYIKENSFATAVDVTQPQYQLAYYGIVAVHFYPPELDEMSILLSGQSIGDYPIKTAEECGAMVGLGMAPCSAVDFDFHIPMNGSYTEAASSFELIEGTVTVTGVDRGRLKGSFNGTARQFGDEFAGERYAPEIEVAITNGTFDVPIITLDNWMGMAQLSPNVRSPLRSFGVR